MLYEISDTDKNNILEFMNRTSLKGAEVPMYTNIIKILSKPIQPEDKPELASVE